VEGGYVCIYIGKVLYVFADRYISTYRFALRVLVPCVTQISRTCSCTIFASLVLRINLVDLLKTCLPFEFDEEALYSQNTAEVDDMGSIDTAHSEAKMSAVQKLRNMLADPDKFIACPGIYDGFTARIALREGVDCLYMVSPPTLLTNFINTTKEYLSDGCGHNNVSPRRSRHGHRNSQ
jgi:hypothetical protein